MQEDSWRNTTDPQELLQHLYLCGGSGERKLCRFLAACCRRLAPWALTDARAQVLSAAEDFAEGRLSKEGLDQVLQRHRSAFHDRPWSAPPPSAWEIAHEAARWLVTRAEVEASGSVRQGLEREARRAGDRAGDAAWAAALRDTSGSSARPRPAVCSTFAALAREEAETAAHRALTEARRVRPGRFRAWSQLAEAGRQAAMEAARLAAGRLGESAGRAVGKALWDTLAAAGEAAEQAAQEAESLPAGAREQIASAGAEARQVVQAELCELLHCLFGNPLRPAIISPAWLAWNRGAVRSLAQTIDETRDFGCLPILADALEDAGCDNADMLNHCRGSGEHGPGCWVIDRLLNRE
jgi:hypothetical protein